MEPVLFQKKGIISKFARGESNVKELVQLHQEKKCFLYMVFLARVNGIMFDYGLEASFIKWYIMHTTSAVGAGVNMNR